MNTTDKEQLTATCEFCYFGGISISSPDTRYCFNPDAPPNLKSKRNVKTSSCNRYTKEQKRKINLEVKEDRRNK